MKKTCTVILFLLILFPFTAKAEPSAKISFENFVGEDYWHPELSTEFSYKHTEYFSSFAFSRSSFAETWTEAMIGFKYHPHKNISLTIGAGVEEHENLWRTMTSIFGKTNFGSILFTFEYGASGVWYKGEVVFNIIHLVETGVFIQSNEGFGPMLRIKMPFKTLTFFIAPLFNYSYNNFNGVIGMIGEV